MTQALAEKPWLKPTLLACLGAIGVVLGAWLAGALFLALSVLAPFKTATPLTLYSYAYWYGDHQKIDAWLWISGFGAALTVLLPIVWLALPNTKRSLHGDARWARPSELRKAKLYGEEGIIVGVKGSRLLRHGGTPMISPHVFLAAPTGGGKTQGLMLPNALTWPGSLVALDVKGELYQSSAGFRARYGQKIYRLNFTARDYTTHQYNPFALVSADPNFLVADVQRIVGYLVQLGKGEDFWPLQARQLFIGIVLYFFAVGKVPTLPEIRAIALNGSGEGLQKWCKAILDDPLLTDRLHPEARLSLGSFANAAENTASGIALTLTTGLTPFLNELTAAVVRGNSCDLRRLRLEPLSIYVVVQVSDRETLAPILRLFFQQLVDLNLDIEFGKHSAHKHKVLLGMDEFATIGKVPAIQESIAYIRSFGMYLLAIVQTPAQLQAVYQNDAAKAFLDNFGCAVFFTPAAQDLAGAEHISKLLGYETVKGVSKSQRGTWGFDDNNRSKTESDQRRALLLPQEVLRLSPKEEIILISGLHPIRATKVFAAKDRTFASRFAAAPAAPRISIEAITTHAAKGPTMQSVHEDDVKASETLDLRDFSLDFSDIELPKHPASEEEIQAICAKLYDKVMAPALPNAMA